MVHFLPTVSTINVGMITPEKKGGRFGTLNKEGNYRLSCAQNVSFQRGKLQFHANIDITHKTYILKFIFFI